MASEDEYDEPDRSPADPPAFDASQLDDPASQPWWRRLDVVHAAALVLAIVAAILLVVIAIERILG